MHSRYKFSEPEEAVAQLRRCGVRVNGKTIWLDFCPGLRAWGAIDYLRPRGWHVAKGSVR